MRDWRVEGGGLHWYVACAVGCLAGPDETVQRCHPRRQAKQKVRANRDFSAGVISDEAAPKWIDAISSGESRKESGDRGAQELEVVCCSLLFQL